MQFFTRKHARRKIAGPEALRKLNGQPTIFGRLSRLDARLITKVPQHFSGTTQMTTNRATNPGAHPAVRSALGKKTVKRQRILDLSRREL